MAAMRKCTMDDDDDGDDLIGVEVDFNSSFGKSKTKAACDFVCWFFLPIVTLGDGKLGISKPDNVSCRYET
jgi:hypothetical protein